MFWFVSMSLWWWLLLLFIWMAAFISKCMRKACFFECKWADCLTLYIAIFFSHSNHGLASFDYYFFDQLFAEIVPPNMIVFFYWMNSTFTTIDSKIAFLWKYFFTNMKYVGERTYLAVSHGYWNVTMYV